MPKIGRRELLLLMLGINVGSSSSVGVNGITRLQKLIFLLEKEERVTPMGDGFEFAEYKAGPYSPRLYDDIELLENLGLIQSEVTGEATDAEAAELDALEFDDLIGEGTEQKQFDGIAAADAYEEKSFTLTALGREKVEQLLASAQYKPFEDSIHKIKSRYAHYSLCDLLYYVYTKYPEMTTESEIKDQVLKRGCRR